MIREMRWLLALSLALLLAHACVSGALAEAAGPNAKSPGGVMDIQKTSFGKLPDGTEAHLFKCTNAHGMTLSLSDYGATIVALETPDRNGRLQNVVLGFDRVDGYLGKHPYFGATVGRYANRIAGGRFTLNAREYKLATNNGPNSLHGGNVGFSRRLWTAEEVRNADSVGVRFRYRSPDGEEGYPGNLDVTATYLLGQDDAVTVELVARTDASTPVNLTNHAYFNLAGAGQGNILDHELMLASEHFLPVDATLIPTGELRPVAGTPFDFRKPTRIGAHIAEVKGDPGGYDHCFVLRPDTGEGKPTLVARVREAGSGRVMEVSSTQPGVQFYTGNFLSGQASENGYKKNEGFCLETQHFPDSPNRPLFPNTILQPGGTYREVSVYRFSVDR